MSGKGRHKLKRGVQQDDHAHMLTTAEIGDHGDVILLPATAHPSSSAGANLNGCSCVDCSSTSSGSWKDFERSFYRPGQCYPARDDQIARIVRGTSQTNS